MLMGESKQCVASSAQQQAGAVKILDADFLVFSGMISILHSESNVNGRP